MSRPLIRIGIGLGRGLGGDGDGGGGARDGEVTVDIATLRAAAARLRGLAGEIGGVGGDGAVGERDSSSIAAKVGEGYAPRSLFGNSDEARAVADDWNDAADARQVDIRVYAVLVAKIAQNLEATADTYEQADEDSEERIKRVPIEVTEKERGEIREIGKGDDQERTDDDSGDGAGGDDDGGEGDEE